MKGSTAGKGCVGASTGACKRDWDGEASDGQEVGDERNSCFCSFSRVLRGAWLNVLLQGFRLPPMAPFGGARRN